MAISVSISKSRSLIRFSYSPCESPEPISSISTFFFGALFNFEIKTSPLFFLLRLSSFLGIFSTSLVMVIFLLSSTFCGICNPFTSTFASLNNWKLFNFLLSHELQCNLNCSWFHDIQGEFRLHYWISNHSHLVRNMSVTKKNYQKKLK